MPEQRVVDLKMHVVGAGEYWRATASVMRAMDRAFGHPTKAETERHELHRGLYLHGFPTPLDRQPVEDWLAEDPPTWEFWPEQRPLGVAMRAATAGSHVEVYLGPGRTIGVDDVLRPW